MSKTLLSCDSLYFSYHTLSGEIPVLENLHFSIQQGEFLSLVGPSGCGKSTFLNILTGQLTPEYGLVEFGYENSDSSQKQSKKQFFGYMPQQDQLFEWYDIWTNVTLAFRIQKCLTEENKAYVDELLKRYGLFEEKYKKPSELSGGMRQRAALIRTLAMRPQLLYLDEPFSALDYQNRLSAANDIGGIIQKENKTAILVTHDIGEAISLSSRILVMSAKPAKIVKEIILPYQKQKLSAMQVRQDKEFGKYFDEIWKELGKNGG